MNKILLPSNIRVGRVCVVVPYKNNKSKMKERKKEIERELAFYWEQHIMISIHLLLSI